MSRSCCTRRPFPYRHTTAPLPLRHHGATLVSQPPCQEPGLTLLTLRGIPIRLHRSFLLLGTLYVGMETWTGGRSGAINAIVLALMLFSCVALHELGHAMMARRYGLNTRDITLYPFGGIARLEGRPKPGWPEAAIAAAGPGVNIALAILALPLAYFELPLARGFVLVNLLMGVLNLLPAFPMDGGRVLRSLLTLRSDEQTATQQSLVLSRILAALLVVGGIFTNIGVSLVGLALLWMVRREAAQI
ncbi:MAG: Zn-dependent protease [Cognaticolwellia sp.]|jgi:Zn-dependent protease